MKKILVILWLFLICSKASPQNNDSLQALLATNIADTVKLKTLSDLSWNYLGSDLNKSEDFARQELEMAKKIKNIRFTAQGYNDVGIVLIRQGKFPEAVEQHKLALELRKKIGNETDIASSYSKLGLCYGEMTDFLKSLEMSIKALAIYEKLNNKRYIAYSLNNICYCYNNLKNYSNLQTYAERSYKLAVEENDVAGTGVALNYISSAYAGRNDYNGAIPYEKKALDVFVQVADSNMMAVALNNIGYYYRMMFKDKEAVGYYTRALEIAQRIKDLNSEALYHDNVGNVYLGIKNYGQAEYHLKQSEKLALDRGLTDIQMLVFKSLADLYVRTGKQDEAINYFNKYGLLKDSLFSKETATKFSEMEVRYKTDKKEAENRILQNENELKTLQLNRSFLIQIFLAVGIVAIIIISVLLYNRFKLKQKEILNLEMLKQQELRSKAVIEAEEKERVRIARELHDGIGQQLSAAKLNISGLQGAIKTTDPNEKLMLQNALDLLDESVKEVRAVSHSMMPNALIKLGLVSAVKEFINKISSTGNLKINLEIIGLDNRLENTTENILFRVLQEVVNNIIKHAKASEISIQLIKHESELTILVEDNGVGFEVSKKLDGEGGIGLRNIQSRVAFLNGEVIFDSFPNKGTTVTIEIPL